MLKWKSNLIALLVVVVVILGVVGAVTYRGGMQQQAVENLRELKVEVFYHERPEIDASYPFLKNVLSADYYAGVDVVNVKKGWRGDVDALILNLNQIPTLNRVVFAFEDAELISEVRQKAPNLEIEEAQPDILRAMAQ